MLRKASLRARSAEFFPAADVSFGQHCAWECDEPHLFSAGAGGHSGETSEEALRNPQNKVRPRQQAEPVLHRPYEASRQRSICQRDVGAGIPNHPPRALGWTRQHENRTVAGLFAEEPNGGCEVGQYLFHAERAAAGVRESAPQLVGKTKK